MGAWCGRTHKGPKINVMMPSKKKTLEGFPGSPVVRTQRFYCSGPASIPGQGTGAASPKKTQKTKQNKKLRRKQKASNNASSLIFLEEALFCL